MIRATVYLATNTVNGHQYVGVTRFSVAQRWKEHVRNAARGKRSYLYAAMRKYGAEHFTVEPVASCLSITAAQATEREVILNYRPAYNQTNGGEFTVGRKTTPEVAARIAEKNRGQKRSAETKEKLRLLGEERWANATPGQIAANIDVLALARARMDRDKQREASGKSARERIWSDESRAKASASAKRKYEDPEARRITGESQRGKVFSNETRALMSASAKRRAQTSDMAALGRLSAEKQDMAALGRLGAAARWNNVSQTIGEINP
jgi:group I intron endonuclease